MKIRVEVIQPDGATDDVTGQLEGKDAVEWLAVVLGWAREGQRVRIDLGPS